MSNWECQNPRAFRVEQPGEGVSSLAAQAHRKQSEGWAGLHRVPVAQRQGTVTVMLGSKNPTTLTGVRVGRRKKDFLDKKRGVTQPMWSCRGNKVLTLVPRRGRAEAKLV